EHFGGIVAGSDAGAANVESHFRRMKEFVKQLVTSRHRKPVEGVARSVGKSRAESEHCLELLAGIQHNRVLGRRGTSSPGQIFRRSIAEFAAGHANRDVS